ncbi:MAG: HAD-IIIA family hydrolase, partial [Acidimicrobiales bacterium]|nr:HAD-IIIA family hydrolase [Acidimicrobiales bacterium]
MIHKAVFLDRDGTIIRDVGYLRNPSEVTLLPGSSEALSRMSAAGYMLILVSNQSGIGRGLITQDQADRVHRRFEDLL